MAGWASRARAILGGWLKRGATPAPAHPGTATALDGRTAVALVEAALSDVASLGGQPDEVAAAFLNGLDGKGTNVLGGPVDGLHAEGPRGAMATAIGLGLSGVRATVFLDGADAQQAFDQVAEAAWRRVPLVVHLTLHPGGGALGGDGGHAGYHALAESGAVLFMAQSVQHAVDLTVAARIIAEQALVPVVVALDEAEIALGVQDVRLPEPVLLEGLVGAPGDRVDCPTPAQRHLLGATRRRVPRWHDLTHPMQLGATMSPELHGLAAAGMAPFFEAPVPGMIDAAFARLAEETGRPLARVEAFDAGPSDTVLVAQGAAVVRARAVAQALRAEGRAKAGVAAVTCLAPLDAGALVDAVGGHPAITVMSRGRRHALSDAVQARLAEAVEAHVHRQPGLPSLAPAKLPRVFRAGYGLAPLRAIDLAVQIEHPRERVHLGLETRPADSTLPKRQALVDLLRADFPQLGADAGRSDAPARDLRPADARTVAINLGDDTVRFTQALAALLHDVSGGSVRAVPGRLTWAPATFLDPGDPAAAAHVAVGDANGEQRLVMGVPNGPLKGPVVSLPAEPDAELAFEQLLGAAAALTQPDVAPRKWAAAREAALASRPRASALAEAFAAGTQGFEAFEGAARHAPPRPSPAVPLALRHLPRGEATVDSLPRMWDHLAMPLAREGVGVLCPDPALSLGAAPALSATFKDQAQTRENLPVLDPEACTGCGACWTVCPEGAVGATAATPAELLQVAVDRAAAAGADTSALGRAMRPLGRALQAAAKAPDAPATFGALIEGVWPSVKASLKLDDGLDATMAAVAQQVSDLSAVHTAALFDEPARKDPKAAALLSLAVNPDACKACEVCVHACEPGALAAVPQNDVLGAARANWARFEALPDTAGSLISQAAESTTLDALAAGQLSRHTLLAMVGGDDAEPASGARLALRLALGVAERVFQARLLDQVQRVEAQGAALQKAIDGSLAEALPHDLGELQARVAELHRADAEVGDLVTRLSDVGRVALGPLQARIEARRGLIGLHERLVKGDAGLGRARMGLVLARTPTTEWAARYPLNPFQAPVTVAGADAARLARGIMEGQLRAAVEETRLLRWAKALVDQPAKAAHTGDERARLRWRDLDPAERHVLPPTLLVVDDSLSEAELGPIFSLLATDLPLKVLVLTDSGRTLAGPAARVGGTDLALLGLARRTAFVAKASFAAPEHFEQTVSAALRHAGPALVLLHAPSPRRDGFAPADLIAQAKRAVHTRAFPLLRYDPAAPGAFGSRLSLQGNPDPALVSPQGTPAEWAGELTRFAGQDVSAQSDAALAVWRTLQELAGLVTPFTEQVRADAEQTLSAQHAAALQAAAAEHQAALATARDQTTAQITAQVTARLMALAGYGEGA